MWLCTVVKSKAHRLKTHLMGCSLWHAVHDHSADSRYVFKMHELMGNDYFCACKLDCHEMQWSGSSGEYVFAGSEVMVQMLLSNPFLDFLIEALFERKLKLGSIYLVTSYQCLLLCFYVFRKLTGRWYFRWTENVFYIHPKCIKKCDYLIYR